MDTFEKQQRIESISGIIKARWISIAIIGIVGLVSKSPLINWSPRFNLLSIIITVAICCGLNFTYWFFIRRPIDKIGDRGLAVVSLCQVLGDQIVYTVVFYYSGSIESIHFIFYFITILIASSLYGKKGIIFAWIMSTVFILGLVLSEYYRIIPHIYPFGQTNPFDNPAVTRIRAFSLPAYLGIAAAFSIVLSGLFRNREKALRLQRDQLTGQTKLLVSRTQELTQTKDFLHEALTKSDKARVELENTKQDLEKANQELKSKINELEKYGEITTGRELKMVELKDKIRALEQRMKEMEEKV
jgi:hypothetical protein